VGYGHEPFEGIKESKARRILVESESGSPPEFSEVSETNLGFGFLFGRVLRELRSLPSVKKFRREADGKKENDADDKLKLKFKINY